MLLPCCRYPLKNRPVASHELRTQTYLDDLTDTSHGKHSRSLLRRRNRPRSAPRSSCFQIWCSYICLFDSLFCRFDCSLCLGMGIHTIAHDCLALSTTSLPPTTHSTRIGVRRGNALRDRAVLASAREKISIIGLSWLMHAVQVIQFSTSSVFVAIVVEVVLSCILARWMGTRVAKKITGCEIPYLGRYVAFSCLKKSLMTL